MTPGPPATTRKAAGASRQKLLFLCHRIPYPPNKGDKIRAYHLLKYLSLRYEIYLGAFIDDAEDLAWREDVERLCAGTYLEYRRPLLATVGSVRGFLLGEALSLPYYRSRAMAAWVRETLANTGLERAVVCSSVMGQYLASGERSVANSVLDFVDVDSDKWRQYAAQKPWPMSWVYGREARLLLQHERAVMRHVGTGFFVSDPEAQLFRQLAPEVAGNVSYFNNGVDAEYFSPALMHANPYLDSAPVLVFTGVMDYWPNVDAMVWFASEVLPVLQRNLPQLQLYIVGSSPARAVQQLADRRGVVVTGRVADVRPYLQHAMAVVAPMRVARGVQNKVLEAMAMAKPVLVTAMGLEGIHAQHQQAVLVCNSGADFRSGLEKLANGDYDGMGAAARSLVLSDFCWEASLSRVIDALGDTARDVTSSDEN